MWGTPTNSFFGHQCIETGNKRFIYLHSEYIRRNRVLRSVYEELQEDKKICRWVERSLTC